MITGGNVATFPIFERIEVESYGLFPGIEGDHRVSFDFQSGTSLIVGVNGLGKTTLLMMLLRALTGPYDLTASGPPDSLNQILDHNPVLLNRDARAFFKQRVSDGAENANSTLVARFFTTRVQITRSLKNLSLIKLNINSEEIALPVEEKERELVFQSTICELFGIKSFVDVLLILHFVIFFMEKRSGALWDQIAQRQILRALLLDQSLAESIPELERDASQTDGEYRRGYHELRRLRQELNDALEAQAAEPEIAEQLSALNAAIEGKSERLSELEDKINEFRDDSRESRLRVERAKLNREEATSEIERHKYGALLRLFPDFNETARLTILRVLSDSRCLVCGADARKRKEELERALEQGLCPNCGTARVSESAVVEESDVERARLVKAKQAATMANNELETAQRDLDAIESRYRNALDQYTGIKSEVEAAQRQAEALNHALPKPSSEIRRLKDTVDFMEIRVKASQAKREEATHILVAAYEQVHKVIENRASELSNSFSQYIPELISENARLTHIDAKAKITQGSPFDVFAFVPEMTAADHSGFARRTRPQDVSESQRELIDLAFRLALIDASASSSDATLVIETPEASLDALAMEQVGKALDIFSRRGENRLIATNNLTNTGMITYLFGGPCKTPSDLSGRISRTLNLLEIAAPNKSVVEHRDRYREILTHALSGNSDA